MQKQVAAVFQIAEIHAQWTAISDRRTDRFFFVGQKSQPNMARASEPHTAIQFVHSVEFNVLLQFFRHDIYAAARGGSNLQKSFFVRWTVRYDANALFRGQR